MQRPRFLAIHFNARLFIFLTTIGCFSLLCFSMTEQSSAQSGCLTAPSGLVAQYTFQSDGTDIKGANNATLFGTTAFAPGKVGNALQFDGTSTYAKAFASSSLNVGKGSGLTIEAWIKVNDVNSGFHAITDWGSGINGASFYVWQGRLNINLLDTGGNNHFFFSDPNLPLTPNVYHHVAATYDKASGIAVIYIDGVNSGSQNFGGNFTISTASNFNIGRPQQAGLSPDGAPDFFAGAIDELSVYNRGLSSEEIQSIVAVGTAGKCAPAPTPSPTCTTRPSQLVSLYPFDNDASDVIGTNNATLFGTTSVVAGKVGNALQFDGSSTYAKANASSSLDIGATANPGITIEGWIKPESISGFHAIAEWGDGLNIGVALYTFNNGLSVRLPDAGGNQHGFNSNSDPALTPNVYHHVALTYDKVTGVATIYADGIEHGTQNIGTFTPLTGYDLYIGRPSRLNATPDGGPDFFFGDMDELSLYNRSLSSIEIQSLFDSGSAGKCGPQSSS